MESTIENDQQIPTHSQDPTTTGAASPAPAAASPAPAAAVVAETIIPTPPIPRNGFLLDAGLLDLYQDLNQFYQVLVNKARAPGPNRESYFEFARIYYKLVITAQSQQTITYVQIKNFMRLFFHNSQQIICLTLMKFFVAELVKKSTGIAAAERYAQGPNEHCIPYAHRLAAEFFNYPDQYILGITRLMFG